MSIDSFALSRKNASQELAQLAEEHMKHDLQQSDRDALNNASKRFGSYTAIGSLVGLGLGALLALRVRRARTEYFKAFRAIEKPTHVKFADGREEALPDLSNLLRPSPVGDFAAYVFFSAGGLFIGGELGLLAGSWSAKRAVTSDAERQKRIERAVRRYRADVLRREVQKLEAGDKDGKPVEVW
ncbi:hypothetical protein BGZ57DRAFT_443641 [Hyaloscypha finlandica]|nr:hypothetical protein BGZ57DRAFT_443641 [Hyaloscypha finlandica]KAH8784515.1 hypothetical protein F5882DRAFT_125346 [Hyaloscypha sp. PMI_1271]